MELFKGRTFGEYFHDTFLFLKRHGKHYFGHFFMVNGIFLMLLVVLSYILLSFYADIFNTSIASPMAQEELDEFMNQNGALVGVLFSLFILLGSITGILTYAYTPLYFQLYEKEEDTQFGTSELVRSLKANLGRMAIYVMVCIVLLIPAVIAYVVGSVILMITIVGSYWLIGILFFIYHGALMEYIRGKKAVFDSFRYSFTLLGRDFWPSTGSMGLFYLMAQVMLGLVVVIPYIFGILMIAWDHQPTNMEDSKEMAKNMVLLMMVVYGIIFLLAIILNCFIQINQAIVYYSLKSEVENIETDTEIDKIGKELSVS